MTAADEEEREEFYAQLQDLVHNVPGGDIFMIVGDMNAKIGEDKVVTSLAVLDLVKEMKLMTACWNFVRQRNLLSQIHFSNSRNFVCTPGHPQIDITEPKLTIFL